MRVGEGEVEEGGFHDVRVEPRNSEECWLVEEHRSMPCLSGVVLRLDSDLLTVHFVGRPTG